MSFVGFYSMPNLIVIMFNLLYPVFHVGFICKGYVWKGDCVKTQGIEDWSVFVSRSRVSIPQTFYFSRLSILIHTFCTYTIYTHITHICWGVLLRENPSHKPWELEIIISTIFYTIACGFSSTPTSLFPYHWEVDSSNTYHTLSKC